MTQVVTVTGPDGLLRRVELYPCKCGATAWRTTTRADGAVALVCRTCGYRRSAPKELSR